MAHVTKQRSLLLCLVFLAAFGISHAVEYEVKNIAASTAGGNRFSTEIGEDYCHKTIITVTDFVWQTFKQTETIERKDVRKVVVYIDEKDHVARYTIIDETEIHISAHYIEGYSGDVREEITGIFYHAVTRVFQWNGNGSAPVEVSEGIADYVRLKAGYESSEWVKPGEGDRWDQGSDVTARFLEYCSSLKEDFVAELNKKMKEAYSEEYFYEVLGKNVDQLWAEYKAYYDYKVWY